MLVLTLFMLVELVQAEPDTTDRLVLTDQQSSYDVGPHLYVLEDAGSRWSLADVASMPLAGRFERSASSVPSFGYTQSTYWLRLSLRDEAVDGRPWLLHVSNMSLDHVDIFTEPDVEGHGTQRLGDALPFSARDIPHRRLVVPLGKADEYTIYVRVASHGPLRLPLKIWSMEAFARYDRSEHLFLGAFFGILVLMAVYFFALYAGLREASYLYFVLYVLSCAAYQLSVERFAFEHIWPENVWWADRSNSTLALFCAVWGLQFSRTYLQARDYAPWLDRALATLMVLCGPLMLFVLLGPRSVVNPIGAAFFVAAPALLLATGITCWLRGNRVALFYLAAWTFLLAATILGMLTNLGVFSYSMSGTRFVQLGSIMQMTLLSVGLGYRYDQLRRERERMRMRIATDLHDDIGSGLTQISLYSELVRRASSSPAAEWAEESGVLARELTGKMQDIVWAIRPEDEGWDALELRMKDYATRVFAPREIEFDMAGEVHYTHDQLSIDVRENVLMMFKETVHNAIKHAKCRRFEVRFQLTRDVLRLRLCDDGRGFDADRVVRNNGLRNLERRARKIRAELFLDSKPGGPTCCSIEIPLTSTPSFSSNGWMIAGSRNKPSSHWPHVPS